MFGDEIVTVAPGSGLPSTDTVPVRLEVGCAKAGKQMSSTDTTTARNRKNLIVSSLRVRTLRVGRKKRCFRCAATARGLPVCATRLSDCTATSFGGGGGRAEKRGFNELEESRVDVEVVRF